MAKKKRLRTKSDWIRAFPLLFPGQILFKPRKRK